MSLQNHLDNLRAKPEHVRRRIAFWSSFGITSLIFVFWLASFTALGANAKGAIAHAAAEAGSPVESLTASVGSFFGDLRDLVWSPKKVQYGDVTVSPGDR